MSILDLHGPDLAAASPRFIQPARPAPEPKFSAWSALTAVPRGAAEAVLQVSASATELAQAPVRRSGMDSADGAMSNPFSEVFRQAGRDLRPDPETGHAAEQLIYQFARGATKIVGGAVAAGPAGVVAAGLEEANSQADELKRQGVDLQTRATAGAVQGAGLALAALPVVGQTLKQTAALYLAGGPGGFMAQQALTREILQRGGYERIGAQFDPFDPVGLAVSALVPAVFAGVGIRAQRTAAAAKAAEDFRAGPVPSDVTPTAAAARQTFAPEVVDAARVAYAVERRAASNPGDLVRGADAHEAALARAEEAISRGESVQVVDMVPPVVADTRTTNFRAWFGDSKVVDAEGQPLVVYHGTAADVAEFSASRLGEITQAQSARGGFFFSSDPRVAAAYALDFAGRPTREAADRLAQAKASGDASAISKAQADYAAVDALERRARFAEGANTVPVHVSMKNPLVVDFSGRSYEEGALTDAIASAKSNGHDGVVFKGAMDDPRYRYTSDVYVAFDPRQIKSAIGNSGRYDPNSASLTDPITEWGRSLQATLDQARTEAGLPPIRDFGATAAQDAPAAPAPTGKPRDLQTEQIALRKQDAVLKKLLECLTNG